MSEFINEREFRIFTNPEKTTYYLITNAESEFNEMGKLIACTQGTELPNAAINVPVDTMEMTVRFISTLGLNFDSRILTLPMNTPLWEFEPSVTLGIQEQTPYKCWYIQNITKVGNNTYSFECVDRITLFDSEQMYGRIFDGELIEDAVRSLTNYSINVVVHDNLTNLAVNGYYRPNTVKQALEELALNYSVVIEMGYTDQYGEYVYVTDLDHPFIDDPTATYNPNNYPITTAQIMQTPEFEISNQPKAVNIVAHNFVVDVRQDTIELFNSRVIPHNITIQNQTYNGEIIQFDRPYSNVSITNGVQILFNKEGYLIFTAVDFTMPTVITGIPYRDDTNSYTVGNTSQETKEVSDIYSIYPLNVEMIATNILNYYEAMPNCNFTLWHERKYLVLGQSIYVPNESGERTLSKIISISTDITPTNYHVSQVGTISDFSLVPPEPELVLDHIEITTLPNKLQYFTGDTIDTTGMVVTAYWDDSSSSIITDYSVYPTTLIDQGTQTITVYYAKNGVVATDSFTIQVNNEIRALVIDTPPNKISYYEGEHMDYTGLTAHLTYMQTPTITPLTTDDLILPSYTFPQYSPETAVVQLTVGYYDLYSGNTYEATVTAYEQNVGSITSINMVNPPTYTDYYEGDLFDDTGMLVVATFSSGVQRVINGYTYSHEPLVSTDVEMTFSYEYKNQTYTWTCPITVHEVTYVLDLPEHVYGTLPIPCVVKAYLDGSSVNYHTVNPTTIKVQNNQWVYYFADQLSHSHFTHTLTKDVTGRQNNVVLKGPSLTTVDNHYAFLNTYGNYVDLYINNDNEGVYELTSVHANTETINPISTGKDTINFTDAYPNGTYYLFENSSMQNEYIPQVAFYCQQVNEKTFPSASTVEIYFRTLQPLANTTEFDWEFLRDINDYTQEEILGRGIKYTGFASYQYTLDSLYVNITNIQLKTTDNFPATATSNAPTQLEWNPNFNSESVNYVADTDGWYINTNTEDESYAYLRFDWTSYIPSLENAMVLTVQVEYDSEQGYDLGYMYKPNTYPTGYNTFDNSKETNASKLYHTFGLNSPTETQTYTFSTTSSGFIWFKYRKDDEGTIGNNKFRIKVTGTKNLTGYVDTFDPINNYYPLSMVELCRYYEDYSPYTAGQRNTANHPPAIQEASYLTNPTVYIDDTIHYKEDETAPTHYYCLANVDTVNKAIIPQYYYEVTFEDENEVEYIMKYAVHATHAYFVGHCNLFAANITSSPSSCNNPTFRDQTITVAKDATFFAAVNPIAPQYIVDYIHNNYGYDWISSAYDDNRLFLKAQQLADLPNQNLIVTYPRPISKVQVVNIYATDYYPSQTTGFITYDGTQTYNAEVLFNGRMARRYQDYNEEGEEGYSLYNREGTIYRYYNYFYQFSGLDPVARRINGYPDSRFFVDSIFDNDGLNNYNNISEAMSAAYLNSYYDYRDFFTAQMSSFMNSLIGINTNLNPRIASLQTSFYKRNENIKLMKTGSVSKLSDFTDLNTDITSVNCGIIFLSSFKSMSTDNGGTYSIRLAKYRPQQHLYPFVSSSDAQMCLNEVHAGVETDPKYKWMQETTQLMDASMTGGNPSTIIDIPYTTNITSVNGNWQYYNSIPTQEVSG